MADESFWSLHLNRCYVFNLHLSPTIVCWRNFILIWCGFLVCVCLLLLTIATLEFLCFFFLLAKSFRDCMLYVLLLWLCLWTSFCWIYVHDFSYLFWISWVLEYGTYDVCCCFQRLKERKHFIPFLERYAYAALTVFWFPRAWFRTEFVISRMSRSTRSMNFIRSLHYLACLAI